MSIASILVDVIVMIVLAFVSMVVIGAFARRVLSVRVGIFRIGVAGILGLVAETLFEAQFVWPAGAYSPALISVQIGIVLFVSVAFLVIAELLVPQGTVPRPDQWLPALRSGLDRSRRYTEIVRIAARHRLVPFKVNVENTSAGSAERTRQAAALNAALEDAGGAFVKLGQILSTRTDVLPAEFTDALSTLQQRVPPAAWEDVEGVMTSALGGPLSDVFDDIDHVPVASASIGQVHLATLRGGERVAVKVQRPGIVPLVERDADIAERIAARLTQSTSWARQFRLDELADSLAGSLRDELDYRIEASNIAAMESAQRRKPEADRIHIPHHHADVSTRDVLVMEYVEGATLSDPDAASGLPQEVRARLATKLFRSLLAQIMDDGVFHADLHPGNVMVTSAGRLALLDFGSIGRIDSEIRRQITDVLLAFSRADSRAFADALIAFVELPDDLDELSLRREIGIFMSRHLGPGGALDVAAFGQVVSILSLYGLAVPSELAVAFRAITTAEGSLRALSPDFDLVQEASEYARQRMASARKPQAVAHATIDEFASLLPMLRAMPRRIDKISAALADGRFSINLRLLADRRDRRVLREFINLASLTFLAGVGGIMATLLLTNGGGPVVTPTMTLFQLFGYLLVAASGVLTLRVLFDILRRRR